jgi:hypothetical protein
MLRKNNYLGPTKIGVVINNSDLSPRATELLRWSELDTVESNTNEFTPAIEHYIEHLEAAVSDADEGNWTIVNYSPFASCSSKER